MNAEHLTALAHTIIRLQRENATRAERTHATYRMHRACMALAETPDAGATMADLEDSFDRTRDYWSDRIRRTRECNAIMYAIGDLRNAMDYIEERNEQRAKRAAYDAMMEEQYINA
jgi:hypothetical protein